MKKQYIQPLTDTRNVLRDFIQSASKFDKDVVINMGDYRHCAFAQVMKFQWGSVAVISHFKLNKPTGTFAIPEKYRDSIRALFAPESRTFVNKGAVTWEEWIARANVVEAMMTSAIVKAELKAIRKLIPVIN